jgi:signal transduction histidine kinase
MRQADFSSPQPPEAAETLPGILVVDDDAPILEAVADILQIHGYNVVTATDGVSGLERLRTFHPDLIISDIMMPDMDGYEFFESVRRNPSWVMIPFMFLTAKGQKTDVRHGYQLGADDFIVKPFETDDLIVKVGLRIKRARDISAAAKDSIEKMKEQLLTIFGHELRTPLTYIYGYANLLQESRGELDEASVDQMLAGIHLGAERLVRLTESLLMMVRIDSGTIAAEVQHRSDTVRVKSMFGSVMDRLAETVTATGSKVETDIVDTLYVRGVEYLLVDAVVRILDNALRHSRAVENVVHVSCVQEDHCAVLEIVDSGQGIAPEDHDRIFDRFVQINRDEMEQQGIGLGLSIAQTLIQLHGGSIGVDSKTGEGAAFRITLPLAEEQG